LRLAIATTTTPANVDALIAHTLGVDALGWFEVIGAGNVVPNLKPAGDIYHHVLVFKACTFLASTSTSSHAKSGRCVFR
jgi:hypothetical protein